MSMVRVGMRLRAVPSYWHAIALRGQPLSAALSSPASAASQLVAERACTDRLSASNRSEHGILGKRRLKLRRPAV